MQFRIKLFFFLLAFVSFQTMLNCFVFDFVFVFASNMLELIFTKIKVLNWFYCSINKKYSSAFRLVINRIMNKRKTRKTFFTTLSKFWLLSHMSSYQLEISRA